MKRLTKKAIASQAKFILIIDRKSEFTKPDEPIEIIKLGSNSIIDAMNEAEKHIDKTIYLVDIAEKTNEVTPDQLLIYRDILVNRTHGWYACDENHLEAAWQYSYNVDLDSFKSLGMVK